MNSNLEYQLHSLLLDEDFTGLPHLLQDGVNLMDILKVSHKELPHSNFLAWLFNPKGSHGLGAFAFKEFIKIYISAGNNQKTYGDFARMNFDDLEVKREYNHIDLIFFSNNNKFCLVIENKIHAKEGKGQLERYRHFVEKEFKGYTHRFFVFLSLERQEITDSEQTHYVQLTYHDILEVIQQTLNNYPNTADKTQIILKQYRQTLKSMLNKNEETERLKEVAQQLYSTYKAAFDLVFEYKASDDNFIWTKLKNKIDDENTPLRSFRSTKERVRFQPDFLYENVEKLQKHGLVAATDDLKNNVLFVFEFSVTNESAQFEFRVGKSDLDGAREKLINICKQHSELFPVIAPLNKYAVWQIAYKKEIINSIEFTQMGSDEVEQLIDDRFNELISADLPKMMSAIIHEIS